MKEINCGRCDIKADCRIIVGLVGGVPGHSSAALARGEWIPTVPRKYGKPEHVAAQRRRVCPECYIIIHSEYINRLTTMKERMP